MLTCGNRNLGSVVFGRLVLGCAGGSAIYPLHQWVPAVERACHSQRFRGSRKANCSVLVKDKLRLSSEDQFVRLEAFGVME